MEEFIKDLEKKYIFIMGAMKSTKRILEDLEAEVMITGNILAPETALEVAEIFEENLNIIVALDYFSVNIPIASKYDFKRLATDILILIKDIAKADAYFNGNLTSFINYVVDKVPVDVKTINTKRHMINLKIINPVKTDGVKIKC